MAVVVTGTDNSHVLLPPTVSLLRGPVFTTQWMTENKKCNEAFKEIKFPTFVTFFIVNNQILHILQKQKSSIIESQIIPPSLIRPPL